MPIGEWLIATSKRGDNKGLINIYMQQQKCQQPLFLLNTGMMMEAKS